MAADDLTPAVARASAAMALIFLSRNSLVLEPEGLNFYVFNFHFVTYTGAFLHTVKPLIQITPW